VRVLEKLAAGTSPWIPLKIFFVLSFKAAKGLVDLRRSYPRLLGLSLHLYEYEQHCRLRVGEMTLDGAVSTSEIDLRSGKPDQEDAAHHQPKKGIE
jgi:hypothetical protein